MEKRHLKRFITLHVGPGDEIMFINPLILCFSLLKWPYLCSHCTEANHPMLQPTFCLTHCIFCTCHTLLVGSKVLSRCGLKTLTFVIFGCNFWLRLRLKVAECHLFSLDVGAHWKVSFFVLRNTNSITRVRGLCVLYSYSSARLTSGLGKTNLLFIHLSLYVY